MNALEGLPNETTDDSVVLDLSASGQPGAIAEAVSGCVSALLARADWLRGHVAALTQLSAEHVVFTFADDGEPIRIRLSRSKAIDELIERARRFENVAWDLHDLGGRAAGSELDRGVRRLDTALREAGRQLRGEGPSRLDISDALLLELESFEAWEGRLARLAGFLAWLREFVQRRLWLRAIARLHVESVYHTSTREFPTPSSGRQLAHLLVAAPCAPPSAPPIRPILGGVAHS